LGFSQEDLIFSSSISKDTIGFFDVLTVTVEFNNSKADIIKPDFKDFERTFRGGTMNSKKELITFISNLVKKECEEAIQEALSEVQELCRDIIKEELTEGELLKNVTKNLMEGLLPSLGVISNSTSSSKNEITSENRKKQNSVIFDAASTASKKKTSEVTELLKETSKKMFNDVDVFEDITPIKDEQNVFTEGFEYDDALVLYLVHVSTRISNS
jgi:BMFP domain-containing protein YqiC